jgi:hypothetical protein
MSRACSVLFSALVALALTVPAAAQQPDTASVGAEGASRDVRGQGTGQVALTNWPASLPELLSEMGRKAPYLLPKIDSLGLDYRYAADDSTSQWSFVLGWTPGDRVLYEGELLPRRRGPDGVRMVNVELRAQMRVDGRHVGDMIVAVDSMTLAPFPNIYSFEVTVGHGRVLLDAPADTARQALLKGATLDSLVVERMGFVAEETSTSDRRRRPDARERRPDAPRIPSIYTPQTRIFIGWRVAPRPYYVDDRDGTRTVRARRGTVGRGAVAERQTGSRTASRSDGEDRGDGSKSRGDRRSPSSDEEDEEDEDDTSLQLPALGAAAAVGVVAYAGGTVGLYGRGDTPLGLAAGYTRPGGGVQLHAAVNSAVLEDEPGQKLTVKGVGFYDVFGSRLQPAAGIGLQIDPGRSEEVVPSVSLGLAGNFGRVVLFGGVDLVQETPELGIAYNFRYGRRDAGN